jgi:proteasome lid subunit RPN8/RPN11
VLESLIDHARQDPRIECCGFLAGRAGTITGAYPAENVAINPATRYEVATKEIVQLTRAIREAGLETLGIYHSHPNGKGEPSETDIAAVGYPDVAYFIISPVLDVETPVRAFSIRDGQAVELEMIVV